MDRRDPVVPAEGAGEGALRDFTLRVGVLREGGGAGLLVFCRVLLVDPGVESWAMAPLTPVGVLEGVSGPSLRTRLFGPFVLWALPLTPSVETEG